MAYIKLEDDKGRIVRVPVFNESEDGSGDWHVPVCDSNGFLKINLDISTLLENPPTEDEADKAPTSEWAFDHVAALAAHTRNPWGIVRTGEYHHFPYSGPATVTITDNTLVVAPFLVVRDMTFDRIAAKISTAISDYTAGSLISITNGSTAVVGSGTTWASSHVGGKIKLDADGVFYTIASVTDTTNLVLATSYVETGGSGAYTIRHYARLGIYNAGSNLYPGTLKLDAGEIPLNGTTFEAITISEALTKEQYFVARVSHVAPGMYRQGASNNFLSPLGLKSTNYVAGNSGWSKGFTYAALPDPFPSGAALIDGRAPHVPMRLLSLD